MRTEQEAAASQPRKPGHPAPLPGGWQAIAIAALSALLAGYGTRPGENAARTDVSRIAEVAPGDLSAALTTVSATALPFAQAAQRDPCSRRLAAVTLVRAPGQPPGRIRLLSGSTVSPSFDLLDTPVRVAIPFPAPYSTGRGMIAVLGTTSGATVALTPAWHVPARGGMQAHAVTWTPAASCPAAGR